MADEKPSPQFLPGLYFLVFVLFFAFVELTRWYRRLMLSGRHSTIVDFRKDFPFLHGSRNVNRASVRATRLPAKADPLQEDPVDDPVAHLVDPPMDPNAVHPAVREEDIFVFGASRPFDE